MTVEALNSTAACVGTKQTSPDLRPHMLKFKLLLVKLSISTESHRTEKMGFLNKKIL